MDSQASAAQPLQMDMMAASGKQRGNRIRRKERQIKPNTIYSNLCLIHISLADTLYFINLTLRQIKCRCLMVNNTGWLRQTKDQKALPRAH